MSGIAGLIQFGNYQKDLQAFVKTMTASIAHRGPKGELLYSFDENGLCLGQRLFRQSTSSDNQTTDENYTLLLDGEIFNRAEIKALLEKAGFVFKSGSSAEVILLSYKHWGLKCLEYFNGAWAMILYDKQKKQLFASRDRVGAKPLYYFKDQKYFAFASEVKALLQLPFLERKMNQAAVFDMFFQNKYETKANFFEGILELQPAHYLTIDITKGEIETKRYYDLPFHPGYESFNGQRFEEYTEKVRYLIDDAVKRQVSNALPASLLSGGIDSSILTCLSKNQTGKAPKVFTSCFESELFDEQKWASIVVNHTQAQWFKTFPELPEFLEDLETLAYCQDTPLTSAGTYSQFRSMRLVKEQGVDIVFDGQGADALFAGQLPHNAALWRLFYSKFKFRDLKREMAAFGSISSSAAFLTKMLLKNAYFPRLNKSLKHSIQLKYFKELHYFNPDFIKAHFHRYDLYRQDQMKSLNHQLYNEYFGGSLKYLLKCVDRSAMWHSVQARTPYSDDLPLMEYVFSIPANYKIRDTSSKVILREAFKGIVPQLILDRKDKKALATPNNEWIMAMRESILPYFESLDGSVFNKKKLLGDFDQFFYLDSPLENYRMFKFIGFAVWRKVFGV